MVPSEEGEVEADLLAVSPIPDAIRTWANDTEAGVAVEA
jgi:hypothetical protein